MMPVIIKTTASTTSDEYTETDGEPNPEISPITEIEFPIRNQIDESTKTTVNDTIWNLQPAEEPMKICDDILKDAFTDIATLIYEEKLNSNKPLATKYPAKLRKIQKALLEKIRQHPIKDGDRALLFKDNVFYTFFSPGTGFINKLEDKRSFVVPPPFRFDMVKTQLQAYYYIFIGIVNGGYLPRNKDDESLSIDGLYERLAIMGVLYGFDWKSTGKKMIEYLSGILDSMENAAIKMVSEYKASTESSKETAITDIGQKFGVQGELKFNIYSLESITRTVGRIQSVIMFMPHRMLKNMPMRPKPLPMSTEKAEIVFRSIKNALLSGCKSLHYCFKAIMDGDSLKDNGKESFGNICASVNAFGSMMRSIITSLLLGDDPKATLGEVQNALANILKMPVA